MLTMEQSKLRAAEDYDEGLGEQLLNHTADPRGSAANQLKVNIYMYAVHHKN